MQALRKPSTEAPLSYGTAVREDLSGPEPISDHAATLSPALALRQHLTARLEELTKVPVGSGIELVDPAEKLAMPVRLAIIVGLSLVLWSALLLGAVAIL